MGSFTDVYVINLRTGGIVMSKCYASRSWAVKRYKPLLCDAIYQATRFPTPLENKYYQVSHELLLCVLLTMIAGIIL